VHYSTIRKEKYPTGCNNLSTFLLFHIYMKLKCFGRHTANHQEHKSALAAYGFFIRGRILDVYLVDLVRHSLTRSFNYTANNLPPINNQMLPVQFYAPDNGWCVA
jgi:hypothetical protein